MTVNEKWRESAGDCCVLLKQTEARKWAETILVAIGFTNDEAVQITNSLLLSERSRHASHGLQQILRYKDYVAKGTIIPNATITTLHKTSSSISFDAGFAAGQVVMPMMIDEACALLSQQAVVSATVRNSGHIGRLGEWVEAASTQGYAALLMVNDNGSLRLVSPPGGKTPVTSTNPIAFSIPLGDGEVFTADMSTSAIAYGKVLLAHNTGKKVPPDCLIDADGHPTTDPSVLFRDTEKGSMTPMGGQSGFKGFAISMFIDLLVAGLSGGQTPPSIEGTKIANNAILTMWNPTYFSGLQHLTEQAKKYVDFVRTSEAIEPGNPIRLPGDRAHSSVSREVTDFEINSTTFRSLSEISLKLKIVPPTPV